MNLCTYLRPIRRKTFSEFVAADLRRYLKILRASGCEVLVIDGSPPATRQ
ncbi:MAG: hypothetical protein ABJB69_00445 [Spartobacteria bacterium]